MRLHKNTSAQGINHTVGGMHKDGGGEESAKAVSLGPLHSTLV